jgi:hypothetical protein
MITLGVDAPKGFMSRWPWMSVGRSKGCGVGQTAPVAGKRCISGPGSLLSFASGA